MTFRVSVDASAWRAHCEAFRDGLYAVDAALIPVVKGNGYGLGQELLAREATRLGVHALAVGTVHEVRSVAGEFSGDILVLEPVEPRDDVAVTSWQVLIEEGLGDRLIRTVASAEGLDFVIDTHPGARIVLEGRSSMRRFGLHGGALREGWSWASQASDEGRIRLLGLGVHLPLAPSNADYDDVLQLVDEVGDPSAHVLLSHIDARAVEILRLHKPRLRISLRVGTALWLGLRSSLHARGTVLAVQQVIKGEPLGYQQRKSRRDGRLLVVAGGTTHGIGLSAPSTARDVRQRLIAIAVGLLDAIGRARSPFTYDGHRLWFVEPPHQQVSMLWLPRGVTPPAIGAELRAEIRFTTTRADHVHLREP